MSAETGLDSWFLHEKLILGLLYQHEIAVLARQLQLPGPDPSLAQAYRIELFERAVSAFLARTDVVPLENRIRLLTCASSLVRRLGRIR